MTERQRDTLSEFRADSDVSDCACGNPEKHIGRSSAGQKECQAREASHHRQSFVKSSFM